MITANALKLEIEAKLAARIPGALSPLARQAPRLQSTGVVAVDALLGGGLPLGSLCELTGPVSSGRTSLALSLLAKVSVLGPCAYVDVGDSLHPHSAAAAGVQLRNLLWVRFAGDALPQSPGVPTSRGKAERGLADSLNLPAYKFSQRGLDEAETAARKHPLQGGCGGHPRTETQGLAPALEGMMAERRQRRMEGTPGYPNQPIGLSTASEEQIAWERFNCRKPDKEDPLRQANQRSAAAARAGLLGEKPKNMATVTAWPAMHKDSAVRPVEGEKERQQRRPWGRLDAALRATDQVLQAGGFRVVVLDLASLRAEEALRVPSATWWRYRRAVGDSDALLVLLTQEPCARSSAACVLQCGGVRPAMRGTSVLTGVAFQAEIARQRTGAVPGRKSPGRVAGWGAVPTWMQAAGQ